MLVVPGLLVRFAFALSVLNVGVDVTILLWAVVPEYFVQVFQFRSQFQ